MTLADFVNRIKEMREIIDAAVVQVEEDLTASPGQGLTKKQMVMALVQSLLGNEAIWQRLGAMVASFLINMAAARLVGSSGKNPV